MADIMTSGGGVGRVRKLVCSNCWQDHAKPLDKFCDRSNLEIENDILKIALSTCKKDYWLMTTLLEQYSSDKDQAIADCIDRMKFREPMFYILEEE
jgi:predicted amidophosphoribosyltransferase